MISTPSGPFPAVEHIDDVVELAYSGLVVSDQPVRTDEQPDAFGEQYFVEWEVPESS